MFTAYRDDLDDEENKFRDKKLRELLNAQGLSINRQKSSYTYANFTGSPTKEAMSCFVHGIPLHLCQFIASKRELKAFLYSAKDGPFGLYRTDTGTMLRELPKENNVIELESYLSAYEAFHSLYGVYPRRLGADSGYGCEENYGFCEDHG